MPATHALPAPAIDHAVALVTRVCALAGSASMITDLRADLRQASVLSAVDRHDTPVLFDWLMALLSYQGIADRVADGYIRDHGNIAWRDVAAALEKRPACQKLGGYWRFYDCGYAKELQTCNEPTHFGVCPLPQHDLRNGRLNQTAYSLFLFIRDVADGDLVAWIDRQLNDRSAAGQSDDAAVRTALVQPLRNIYGVSDKVVSMALATLLIGAGRRRPRWFKAGASLVAVDTLVHNFLQRTGILRRLAADHPYGVSCYRRGGCADVLQLVAAHIDATAFNPAFPPRFPRFVQHAIWHYCAQSALDVCNGNRIDDSQRCAYAFCRVRSHCDRVALGRKIA